MRSVTKNDKYNETWLAMSDWITENAQKENIKHVIAGGSYSNNNGEAGYKRALKGLSLFSNDISWSALAGNLDYKANTGVRDSSLYQK